MIAVAESESLTSVLARLGYAHAPGLTPCRRSIQREGVEVLQASAHEAWDWLRATGQIVATSSRAWEPELVEHLAVHFAEVGDTAGETICDEVLDGKTAEDVILRAVRNDPALAEVVALGSNLGWRSRS